MIREWLKKLKAGSAPGPRTARDNGRGKIPDQVEVLKACYYELRRLGEQIQAHAERAPYPHIAERLKKVAAEKLQSANILKDKIQSYGGTLADAKPEPKWGKNHWERTVRDLEDQRALEANFLERALDLADAAPELSELLRTIAAEQAHHKDILSDLVCKADPQAYQS